MADWQLRLEQFLAYRRHERRFGLSAERQYRSIVKDWIEFSLARDHDPAVFDAALIDALLDQRAGRNWRGVMAPSSRRSYTSNLKVFCEWASGGCPQAPPVGRIDSVSASPRRQQTRREALPGSATLQIETWAGPLPAPIDALERLFHEGGTTVVRAAFQHSFFIHPAQVRKRTPWYPERVRTSRKHYPDRARGDTARWKGRAVTLGDNAYAQLAWSNYSGRPLERRSGFSVRHIWGNPWDPDAFTAGWNLCYMPFWAGMLTERQHPHPQLQPAIRQAAWDLYFAIDPVCEPPDFVEDPGLDLADLLAAQPIRVLEPDWS